MYVYMYLRENASMQYFEEKSFCMLSTAMAEYIRSWLVSRKILRIIKYPGTWYELN